jgi:hypothetical protein
MNHTRAIAITALLALTASTHAITVPFTESFSTGNANWTNSANAALEAVATGGPDNSPYASTTFNFAGTNAQSTPAILRAQSTTNASNGNFFGDWITSGATQVTLDIRHNSTAPLSLFARWTGASSPAAPGWIILGPSINGGAWTSVTFPINSASNFPEPGANFNAIFSSVVRMQFGVLPGGLAGVNTTVRFDIDNVTITPTPAAASLLAPIAALTLRRNR